MGCAPSIHISESRETFHGGKEAEDAPGPAAPLPPGQRSLPRRQTTATPGARGAGLAEPKPRDRDRSSDTVRGTGRAAAAFPQGRAGRPPGPVPRAWLWVTLTDAAARLAGLRAEDGPRFSDPDRWSCG